MFAFNWSPRCFRIERNDTVVCGWLIENRSFLSVIEDKTLLIIFEKLVSLIDAIADELDERFRENAFSCQQQKMINNKTNHLKQICHNLKNYGLA